MISPSILINRHLCCRWCSIDRSCSSNLRLMGGSNRRHRAVWVALCAICVIGSSYHCRISGIWVSNIIWTGVTGQCIRLLSDASSHIFAIASWLALPELAAGRTGRVAVVGGGAECLLFSVVFDEGQFDENWKEEENTDYNISFVSFILSRCLWDSSRMMVDKLT